MIGGSSLIHQDSSVVKYRPFELPFDVLAVSVLAEIDSNAKLH